MQLLAGFPHDAVAPFGNLFDCGGFHRLVCRKQEGDDDCTCFRTCLYTSAEYCSTCLFNLSSWTARLIYCSLPASQRLEKGPLQFDLHSPKMNFDQILSAIGGFGKYQKILYIWICLPQVLLAFHMMVSIFTGATPPYRCRESSSSATENQTLSLNFSLSETSCLSSDVLLPNNRTERGPCGRGWAYSQETFQSTTVTEVGWRLGSGSVQLQWFSCSIDSKKYFINHLFTIRLEKHPIPKLRKITGQKYHVSLSIVFTTTYSTK